MVTQPSLFGDPKARRTDPSTSWEAARQAAPRAPTDRARVLATLQAAGSDGLTDFELADRLGRQQTSVGVRRGELVRAGRVVNSGRRRPAPSGAAAIVWVAT